MSSIRRSEINRRRARHRKLGVLRKRYANARTESERSKIIGKLKKMRPPIFQEQFLASIKPVAPKP